MTELTPSETGILLALASGDTQAEIAKERYLSLGAVATEVRHLRAKLGAQTTAHAVAIAYHKRIFVVPGGRA